MCLGGVFDDHGPAPGGDIGDGGHRRHLAEEMHWDHSPGLLGQGRLQASRIEQQVIGIHVGERRPGTRADDGLRGRDEGIRRHDHLGSGGHLGRAQGQLERVGAVAHPNAVRDAGESCVLSLEGGCHLALDEGGAAHDLIEACLDLRRHLSVRSPHVHQRYHRHRLCLTVHHHPSRLATAITPLSREPILLPPAGALPHASGYGNHTLVLWPAASPAEQETRNRDFPHTAKPGPRPPD